MTTDTEINIDEKITREVKEPSNYNVIMLNDDTTPMEWVLEILQEIFRHSIATSQELMRFYAYCLFLDKTVTHARTAKWIPNRNSLDLEGSHYHQKSFTQACRRRVYKFHRKRALPKERRVSSSSLKS